MMEKKHNEQLFKWNSTKTKQQQNKCSQSVTTKSDQLNGFENENISRPKSMKP